MSDVQPTHHIELPDGVVLSGAGGDVESLRESFEDRAEERQTGVTVQPDSSDQTTKETKPSRGQKRFSELTSERDKATHRAEQAEARIRELEAKLSSQPAVETPAAPVKQSETAKVETRPKPTADQIGEKYQTYEDFIEDLADWKSEQRALALEHKFDARLRDSIEADRASRGFEQRSASISARGREAYPDFDAVIASATEPFAPEQFQAILALPNAEHVVYHLAKDSAKRAALLKSQSPIEFGMLLAGVVPTGDVAPPASTSRPVARTTQAPPPYQPVGSGSRTTPPSLEALASAGQDFDASGYRERRAAERRAAGR